MIIYMSDILCITNRSLCGEDFIPRIEMLAAAHPKGIILREKDLDEESYKKLAEEVIGICRKNGTLCILHGFPGVAADLGCKALHLPLDILRRLSDDEKKGLDILGASCHSVEDAAEAESLGCTYITAGHIFNTDCKKGVPGRGLDFLHSFCRCVSVPVYAIGGIDPSNIDEVRKTGAAGACIMSHAMVCADAQKYLLSFGESQNEIQ